MAWFGGQYVVTGTAVTLQSALGAASNLACKNIDVKAKATNGAPVYLGGSTVTAVPANARVEITAGAAWSSSPFMINGVNTNEVYIVGTPGDIVFISLVP